MPIGESLKLTKQEPMLSDRVRHAIFSFEVAMKVDIADSSDIGGAVSGRAASGSGSAAVGSIISRINRSPRSHDPVRKLPR